MPKVMFSRTLYSLFFSIIINLSSAQTYSSQQVIEDLDFLSSQIQQYNPALDQFNPNFDSIVQKIRSEVNGDYTALEHFQIMARIAAQAREGHMSVGDWKDTVHSGFNQDRYLYLPFLLKIIDNEIFIWKVYSEEQELNDGDQILSINGKSSKDILKEFESYLCRDGNIKTSINHQLNVGFAWMYYLYIDQSKVFDIEYFIPSDGNKAKTKLKALKKSEMVKNYKIQYGINNDPPKELGNSVYYFTIEENMALLKLKTFNRGLLKKEKVKSKKFYKEIFEELAQKNCKNLIIDLRGNNGGRIEMSEDILPFILKTDSSIVYRSSLSWKGKTKEFELPEKSEFAFSGNIFVLVDGQTFSAGASLARYLREYAGAIIIGEEAAGRYEGFVAGSKEYIVLENSKLKIGIPRYATLFPASNIQTTKDRGIIPDYTISYSFEDLVEEKDLAMEKVKSLILNP